LPKSVPENITKFENTEVRGYLHRPEQDHGPGLVFTHGAGANCANPLLVALASAFCSAGFFVLRFDLAFRQRRPFGPPHPSGAAQDRNSVRAAIDAMRSLHLAKFFAGGHSYGGRQTTLLAADAPAVCDALLLLSYPLHPPKKPSEMRTAHFPALQTPALFVHGSADPFGSPEEMRAAIRLIPSRTEVVFIEGAGHDLNRGKFDVSRLVIEPFVRLSGS
jgi:uncharacterized protein